MNPTLPCFRVTIKKSSGRDYFITVPRNYEAFGSFSWLFYCIFKVCDLVLVSVLSWFIALRYIAF